MKNESLIFGPKEMEEIKLRLEGGKNNYSIWYYTKKKLCEIENWDRKKIKKLLRG